MEREKQWVEGGTLQNGSLRRADGRRRARGGAKDGTVQGTRRARERGVMDDSRRTG